MDGTTEFELLGADEPLPMFAGHGVSQPNYPGRPGVIEVWGPGCIDEKLFQGMSNADRAEVRKRRLLVK